MSFYVVRVNVGREFHADAQFSLRIPRILRRGFTNTFISVQQTYDCKWFLEYCEIVQQDAVSGGATRSIIVSRCFLAIDSFTKILLVSQFFVKVA